MLIEYIADDAEHDLITKWLDSYEILEWYNPEEYFFVLETQDSRVATVLGILGIEFYIVNTNMHWHEYAFGNCQR